MRRRTLLLRRESLRCFLRLALALAAALAPAREAAALLETEVAVCRAPFNAAGDPTCTTAVGASLAEATDPGPPALFSFFGTGLATASFGTLGFEGSFSLLAATGEVVCLRDPGGQVISCPPTVSARASFDDVLTVGGNTGSGSVVIRFVVGTGFEQGCGTIEPCPPPPLATVEGTFSARFEAGSPGSPGSFALREYDSDPETPASELGGAFTTSPVPITFGEPFALVVGLEQIGTGPDPEEVALLGPVALWDSQGILAMGARLSSIAVFDAIGAPVPGATVSALSGTVYRVPEPAGALAALAALLPLAAIARARIPRGS